MEAPTSERFQNFHNKCLALLASHDMDEIRALHDKIGRSLRSIFHGNREIGNLTNDIEHKLLSNSEVFMTFSDYGDKIMYRKRIKIKGDGDCLWSSLSMSLFLCDDYIDLLKSYCYLSVVKSYLNESVLDYESFCLELTSSLGINLINDKNISEVICSYFGHWGGSSDLLFLSDLFDVKITIYLDKGDLTIGKEDSVYHMNLNHTGDHYDIVSGYGLFEILPEIEGHGTNFFEVCMMCHEKACHGMQIDAIMAHHTLVMNEESILSAGDNLFVKVGALYLSDSVEKRNRFVEFRRKLKSTAKDYIMPYFTDRNLVLGLILMGCYDGMTLFTNYILDMKRSYCLFSFKSNNKNIIFRSIIPELPVETVLTTVSGLVSSSPGKRKRIENLWSDMVDEYGQADAKKKDDIDSSISVVRRKILDDRPCSEKMKKVYDPFVNNKSIENISEELERYLSFVEAAKHDNDARMAKEMGQTYNKLSHLRHDYFGFLFMSNNGLRYTDDINFWSYLNDICHALDENLAKKLSESVNLSDNDQALLRRLTPDGVLCFINKNAQMVNLMDYGDSYEEGDKLVFCIIDYTCSYGNVTISDKKEKYLKLSGLLLENMTLFVLPVVLDLKNDTVKVENNDFNINAFVLKSEEVQLITRITGTMLDMQRRYGKYDNFSETLKKDKMMAVSIWDEALDFKITTTEFKDHILYDELLIPLLNEANMSEKDFLSNLEELTYDSDLHVLSCKNMMEKLEDRIYNKINLENIKSEFYKRPDSSSLEVSFEAMSENAKRIYREIEKSKIIMHLPVVRKSSNLRFEEVNDNFQLNNLREFQSIINVYGDLVNLNTMNSKDKYLLNFIKDLLDPYKEISHDMIKEKKDLTLMTDGSVFSTEEFRLKAECFGFKKDPKSGEDTEIKQVKAFIDKHMSFIYKGRDIKSQEEALKEVKSGLVLGALANDASIKYGEKVDSLNYWDHSKLEKHLSFYTSNRQELDYLFDSLGEDIYNKDKELDNELDLDGKILPIYQAVKNYLDVVDSFYKNMTFIMTHGSKGFRFVFCKDPNIIGIVFPGDSILKSETVRSYMICVRLNAGDEYKSMGQEFFKFRNKDGRQILLSRGKSESHKSIAAKVMHKERFISTFGILTHLLENSRHSIMTGILRRRLMMDVLNIVVNVNINNSSLFDNLRYLANNCLADFSAADDFIKEKLMIPCKNALQIYLLCRTKKFLLSLNESAKSIKVEMDDDEEHEYIDVFQSVTDAEISSFLTDSTYDKPLSVLQEVITLFFSTTKGLHGKMQNAKEIHKTPIEIQICTDRQKVKDKLFDAIAPDLNGGKRHQFNLDMICLASIKAQLNSNTDINGLRQEVIRSSDVNSDPMKTKTLTSTRSCLKTIAKDNFCLNSVDDVLMGINIKYGHKSVEYVRKFLIEARKLCRYKGINEKKRMLKKLKTDFRNFNEEVFDYFMRNIKFNKKAFEFELKISKDNFYGICQNDSTVEVSVPTLSEYLNKYKEDYRSGSSKSIGTLARNFILFDKERFKFAIRPKGQRTQKDREIYVGNLKSKICLFNLEHIFKSVCIHQNYEKISEPGDNKLISQRNQMSDVINWKRQKTIAINNLKAAGNEINEAVHVLNMNIDMTKWSPKDNILKFVFVIMSSMFLKKEEKMALILVILEHYKKLLFIDYSVLRSSKTSSDQLMTKGIDVPCLFRDSTNNFTSAYVNIKENWFQGMLNYISSYVHAGMMTIWTDLMENYFGKQSTRIQSNTHSDDNQTTIAVVTNLSLSNLAEKSMGLLEFLTSNVALEASTKKNYLSTVIKEFVSQVNVAGEQQFYWCKPLMSMVSGTPYTTIKDDICSVYSKYVECIIKGGPSKIANAVANACIDGIKEVYGFKNHNHNNILADELSIDQDDLPMALGNNKIHDFGTMCLLGPASMDILTLKKLEESLLNPKKGNIDQKFLAKLAPNERAEKERKMKALKIFYIFEQLSKILSTGVVRRSNEYRFNPFKSIKFNIKGSNIKDPFSNENIMQRKRISDFYLTENPGLAICKPTDPCYLFRFYYCMYLDPTFRASLTGQSPEALMLHKICSKNTTGNFTLKSDIFLHNDFLKSQEEWGSFTIKGLSNALNGLMTKLTVSDDKLNEFLNGCLREDIELNSLLMYHNRCYGSSIVSAPKLSPLFSSLSVRSFKYSNNISEMLCYIFDQSYFDLNRMSLKYPFKFDEDLSNLFVDNPDILVLALIRYDTDAHIKKVLDKLKMVSKGQLSVNRNLMKLRENFDTKLMSTLFGECCLWENVIDKDVINEEYIKNFDENYYKGKKLYEILKVFTEFDKRPRGRVFMLPRGTRDTLPGIYCGLRSVQSIHKNSMNQYVLSDMDVSKVFKLIPERERKIQIMKNYSQYFANIYSGVMYLDADDEEKKEILLSASIDGISFKDYCDEFHRLDRRSKLRLINPLIWINKNRAYNLVGYMDGISVNWSGFERTIGEEAKLTVSNNKLSLTIKTVNLTVVSVVVSIMSTEATNKDIGILLNRGCNEICRLSDRNKGTLLGMLKLFDKDRIASVNALQIDVHTGKISIVKAGLKSLKSFRIIQGSLVQGIEKISMIPWRRVSQKDPFTTIVSFSSKTTAEYKHKYVSVIMDKNMKYDNDNIIHVSGINVQSYLTSKLMNKILNGNFYDINKNDVLNVAINKENVIKDSFGQLTSFLTSWLGGNLSNGSLLSGWADINNHEIGCTCIDCCNHVECNKIITGDDTNSLANRRLKIHKYVPKNPKKYGDDRLLSKINLEMLMNISNNADIPKDIGKLTILIGCSLHVIMMSKIPKAQFTSRLLPFERDLFNKILELNAKGVMMVYDHLISSGAAQSESLIIIDNHFSDKDLLDSERSFAKRLYEILKIRMTTTLDPGLFVKKKKIETKIKELGNEDELLYVIARSMNLDIGDPLDYGRLIEYKSRADDAMMKVKSLSLGTSSSESSMDTAEKVNAVNAVLSSLEVGCQMESCEVVMEPALSRYIEPDSHIIISDDMLFDLDDDDPFDSEVLNLDD